MTMQAGWKMIFHTLRLEKKADIPLPVRPHNFYSSLSDQCKLLNDGTINAALENLALITDRGLPIAIATGRCNCAFLREVVTAKRGGICSEVMNTPVKNVR